MIMEEMERQKPSYLVEEFKAPKPVRSRHVTFC